MQETINKLLLLIFIFSFQVVYAQESIELERKKCDEFLQEKVVDIILVKTSCIKVAQYYEKKEEYFSASWYYLLSGENDKNINTIESKLKSSSHLNIGHSYVLLNQFSKVKKIYQTFLENSSLPWANEAMQDDFKLLLKLNPEKKEELVKGLEIWNELYKPLLPIDNLYKKYKQARKEKRYQEAIDNLIKVIELQKQYLNSENLDIYDNLFSLGVVYNYSKEYEKSIKIFKEVESKYKKYPSKEKSLGYLLGWIADSYENIKDYEKAIEYYKSSLVIKEKVLGKEHTSTATSYNNIGLLYKAMNNYPKALEYFKKSLEIKEKVFGFEHTDTATSYNNIGLLYKAMNDYPKALEYYKKSLEINEKVFGFEHTDTATSYNNIGSLYKAMNNYPKALEYYKKSLEINEKIFGFEHTDTATSYNNIGLLYQDMNDYPKALEYLKKSLEIYEKVLGKEHTNTATSYNNIGSLYKDMNDYPKALEYYKKSLEIKEKVLGKEHTDTARGYNNIGLLYQAMNDYPKALEYFKKSLEINEKVLGKEHTGTAVDYNNIGLLYQDMNDYPKALEYFKKSLEIKEKVFGFEHTDTAISYNNIGSLYQYMNDYPKALEYLKKSLEINEKVLGKEHTDTAISYNNIGLLYQIMNDYPKALEYLKKSLEINEKVFGFEHTGTATSYNNIGLLYQAMNDYPKALEYYKKSLEIIEKVLGFEHTNTASSYNNIGSLYQDMNDYPNAYKYSKKSFDIFIKNRDKNFTILDNKQKLEYVKANSDKLEFLFSSAILYKKEIKKSEIPDWLKGSFSESNPYKDAQKKVEDSKVTTIQIDEETLNDWLNYKGAIFDSENNMVVLYEKVKDKEIKEKIEELNGFKQQLSKLYQTIPKADERENYKQKIEELEKNISNSEIYLSSKLDEFKEELGLRNIKYKDISKHLKDEEIYIDFAKTEDNYFVFTLDNKNNITFEKIDSKITSNINKNVKLFRENIDTLLKSTDLTKEKLDTLNSDAKTVLSNLYEDIVNNLGKTVSNIKTKDTLIFSLDGVLNFLPFEALYDKRTNQYLIEKKNIKYVPSGKEFVRLLNKKIKQTKTSKDVTMFTNPDYGLNLPAATTKSTSLDTPNTRASSFLHKSLFSMIFNPLPGTKEEANLISKLYSNAKDYNQDQATSINLFEIESPKILHISTHGFFLNDENIENPMLKSGLAFAGANMAKVKGDSQGVVTGLKLAGLNLTNTDLVVLSACETGLGDIKGSEGVTGLNKAFIKAGAKNIVMSLWSVADKETAELMKEFYSNVKDTNNYQQSLKDSKMKMIKQNLHPFYWSAFIMNGV